MSFHGVMSTRALIVIDMQRDLCADPRRSGQVQEALPTLRRAISEFCCRSELVVYTCFALPPGDGQFARFGDVYCVEGTPGAELIPELSPPSGPVITKTKHSAFFATDLDRVLTAAGIREVYLAGLQTQICVMTTAADAHFRGYRVVVLRDCVVSSREETKLDALEWIERYVGEIRSSDEVLASLDG